jgi:hypothetical protein
LISSSYKIRTYWNIAFHCPLVAGEKKNSLVDVSAAPYLSKYSSKF